MPAWDGETNGPRSGAAARTAGGALVLRVFVTGAGGYERARVEATYGSSIDAPVGGHEPRICERFEVPAGATRVEIIVVEEEHGQPAR